MPDIDVVEPGAADLQTRAIANEVEIPYRRRNWSFIAKRI
jgi:hypothetical protein